MTLDTNHLRQLHKSTRNVIRCQRENSCVLQSNSGLMCDYCRFHFECFHDLPELLDRSDAFTEALRLLRREVENARGSEEWWMVIPERGGVDVGATEALLARFPEEATS